MKKFELPRDTFVHINKATPRKEHHGDDLVQAISLRFSWTTTNDSLDKLHPNLKPMLFWKTPSEEAQAKLDGVAEITPNLRCPTVATPLKVEADFSGYTLVIDHGIDESTALELYQCTLDKFTVDPKEGGSVTIAWSLSSNKQVTPELVGALCGLEGEEVTVELIAPTVQDVIDGTQEAFDRDHPADGDGPLFDGDGPSDSEILGSGQDDEHDEEVHQPVTAKRGRRGGGAALSVVE